MWYNNKTQITISYDKPIIAESSEGKKYLLLPVQEEGSYSVIGYDWFDIDEGRYNSCCQHKTVDDALRSYSSYKIYNAKIEIRRI